MTYQVAKTLKRVFLGGLCGYIMLTPLANSTEVDTENPDGKNQMTVLKEWTPDDDLNGSFEADRRAWLASLRAQMNKENPDLDEIVVETLNDENLEAQEYSRDTLTDYMDQIRKELREP